MRKIQSKDTSPEMKVRRLVHALGFRYRLHVANLPGKPDIVFRPLQKVIDIRGCFWHQHQGCIDSHIPKSRREYWEPKLTRNVVRDGKNLAELKRLGWKVLVVWECETKNLARVQRRIVRFLGGLRET